MSRPRFSLPWHRLALLGILGLLVSACNDDTSVNPFIEGENYYTLYGYLDTATDTQYLRVVPLRKAIGAENNPEIDAAVSSTAVESGVTTAWQPQSSSDLTNRAPAVHASHFVTYVRNTYGPTASAGGFVAYSSTLRWQRSPSTTTDFAFGM